MSQSRAQKVPKYLQPKNILKTKFRQFAQGPLTFQKFCRPESPSSGIETWSNLYSFFITFQHLSNGANRAKKRIPDQNGAVGTPGS